MTLPRAVREIRGRLFGRIHLKGGEHSFALGPASDPGAAAQRFYTIKVMAKAGVDPEEIRRAIEGNVNLGSLSDRSEGADVTVSQAIQRWLAERVEAELEARNAAIIRSRVEQSLLPCLGRRALASIRRTDCHAYLAYLRKTRPDLKPSTVRHYLRDMREVLNWSEEVELIDVSPWPKKRIMPRVEKRPPDRLTDEEVAVLVSLPGHWGFTNRFLLAAGIRWGEGCRARRRDIQDGHLLIRKSKSGKPRYVPLSRAILQEINRQGGDWIVPRQRNAPGGRAERSSSSFNATIRRLVEKRVATMSPSQRKAVAGLERFHVHQTRHTFACRYLEAGGTLTMLQEILGHASMEQTQQYGRPDARAIRSDANRVFDVWAAAVSGHTGNKGVPGSMQEPAKSVI